MHGERRTFDMYVSRQQLVDEYICYLFFTLNETRNLHIQVNIAMVGCRAGRRFNGEDSTSHGRIYAGPGMNGCETL
jgi:hypothetical protein